MKYIYIDLNINNFTYETALNRQSRFSLFVQSLSNVLQYLKKYLKETYKVSFIRIDDSYN